MKKLLFAFIALCFLSLSVHAYTIFSYGNKSCGNWIEAQKTRTYLAIFIGYWVMCQLLYILEKIWKILNIALTEELIKVLGPSITVVPVFLFLYQEGRKGGVWDVKLDKGGIPLFIQLKLSHYLKIGHFSTPYYRMHIRPNKHSKQHELLLEL